MNKDNILAAARREKFKGKEFENKEEIRSSTIGYAIVLILGIILVLVEYFAKGTLHFGMLALGATSVGVDNLFLGIKFTKYGKIIFGACMLFIAALFILIYIGQVVAA